MLTLQDEKETERDRQSGNLTEREREISTASISHLLKRHSAENSENIWPKITVCPDRQSTSSPSHFQDKFVVCGHPGNAVEHSSYLFD